MKYIYQNLLLISLISGLTACNLAPEKGAEPNQGSIVVNAKAYPGSSFDEIQAQVEINRTINEVYQFLADLQRTPAWFENASKVKLLEIYDNQNFLLYTHMHSPWPFESRDIVTCIKTELEADERIIHVKSCPDKHPLQPGITRVQAMSAQWQLTKLGEGRTLLKYKVWLEPEGYVPAFFYNLELPVMTRKSLEHLKQQVEEAELESELY